MGTTAEKLQAVKASKEAIREALEAKGVQIGDAPLADYAVKIGEIEVERTSLNLDLKAIYDQYPEYPYRMVFQIRKDDALCDTVTFDFSSEYYYPDKLITSDGQEYTSFPATHTWNTSKDIDEDYPYPMKTRWIVLANMHSDMLLIPNIASVYQHIVALFCDFESNVNGTDQGIYFMYLGEKQALNHMTKFSGCYNLRRIPSQFVTTGRENFDYLYENCRCITTIPPIDTSAATYMYKMFSYCNSLRHIPALDTHHVTNMSYMFEACKLLETIPQFDFASVTEISCMFSGCENLKWLGNILIPNCLNTYCMFENCYLLSYIKEIDISCVETTYNMFYGCRELQYIRFAGIIPVSLSLSDSTLLDKDSLMSAINALKDLTEADSQTLTLGTENLNKLSDEQKAIATAKNWILN